MKARIHRSLLEQTRFDSGALSPTDFVVHPYHEPGLYRAEVRRHGRHQYSFHFEVSPESREMQLTIDLADPKNNADKGDTDCGCKPGSGVRQLAPGGYALFYTATGSGGYSVRTFPAQATEADGKQVFDSTALQEEDLFGITLLRPGYYVFRDVEQDLQCRLHVEPVLPGKEAYVPPEALHLDSREVKSAKQEIRLLQAQGLVYRSHAQARILIELEKPIDVEVPPSPPRSRTSKGHKKAAPRKPVASWKKAGVQR